LSRKQQRLVRIITIVQVLHGTVWRLFVHGGSAAKMAYYVKNTHERLKIGSTLGESVAALYWVGAPWTIKIYINNIINMIPNRLHNVLHVVASDYRSELLSKVDARTLHYFVQGEHWIEDLRLDPRCINTMKYYDEDLQAPEINKHLSASSTSSSTASNTSNRQGSSHRGSNKKARSMRTKTIVIRPNRSHEVAIEIDADQDESVNWEYTTVDSLPIHFQVTLVHESEATSDSLMVESNLVEPGDSNAHCGTLELTRFHSFQNKKGLLLLKWENNSYGASFCSSFASLVSSNKKIDRSVQFRILKKKNIIE